MKKIILILSLILYYNCFSSNIEDRFKFEPEIVYKNYDLWGLIAGKNNIVAYGESGYYKISTNKGITWDEKNIPDVGDILKVISQKNENGQIIFLGFSSNGSSLISLDEGITWETQKLEYLDSLVDFDYDDNYFYIRTYNSIIAIDFNYNLISKYDNNLLNYRKEFTNDYLKYNLHLKILNYNNHILFNIFQEDSNFVVNPSSTNLYVLNKSDLLSNIPKIDSIIICSSCSAITRLFKLDSSIIFNLIYIDSTRTEHEVVKQIDLNLQNIKDFNSKFPLYTSLSSGNDFYYFYNTLPFSFTNPVYFKYYFIKNDFSKQQIDTVGKSDSLLFNVDLYVIYYSEIAKFQDSILLIVGQQKTIFISTNNGKKWNLATTEDRTPINKFYYLKDSLEVRIKNIYNTEISHDKSNTFQQTIGNYNNIKSLDFNQYLTSYLDTLGNLLIVRNPTASNDANILLSKNFGMSYNGVYDESIRYQDANHVFFDKINNNYCDVFTTVSIVNHKYYSIAVKWDENMVQIERNIIGIDLKVYSAYMKDDSNIFMFAIKPDTSQMVLKVLESNDFGKSYKEINKQILDFDYFMSYEIGNSKDSIIIISYKAINKSLNDSIQSNILLYVHSTNSLQTLYSANEPTRPNILLTYNNKLFIVGYNFFLENTDRNNLLKWKKEVITDSSNWTYVNTNNIPMNLGFQTVNYSSPNYTDGIYRVKFLNISDVKTQPEKALNINSNPAYPIPATDFVSDIIYFDKTYDLNKAVLGIYDLFGNKVGETNQLKINQQTPNSAMITWDCSSIQTGTYFISVSILGESKLIPVLVQR